MTCVASGHMEFAFFQTGLRPDTGRPGGHVRTGPCHEAASGLRAMPKTGFSTFPFVSQAEA